MKMNIMKTKREVKQTGKGERDGTWVTWAPGGLWWDVEPWCSWHTGRLLSSHPGSPPPGSRAGPRPSGPAPAALASEPPRGSQGPPRSPSTAAVGSHHAPGRTDGKTQLLSIQFFLKLLLLWCISCLYLMAESRERNWEWHATNDPVRMWNGEAINSLNEICHNVRCYILEITFFFFNIWHDIFSKVGSGGSCGKPT